MPRYHRFDAAKHRPAIRCYHRSQLRGISEASFVRQSSAVGCATRFCETGAVEVIRTSPLHLFGQWCAEYRSRRNARAVNFDRAITVQRPQAPFAASNATFASFFTIFVCCRGLPCALFNQTRRPVNCTHRCDPHCGQSVQKLAQYVILSQSPG